MNLVPEQKTNVTPDAILGVALFCLFIWLMTGSAPTEKLYHSDKSRHMAVITAIFESRGQPLEGQLAVLAVMSNRLTNPKYQWKTLEEVVRASGMHKGRRVFQFEPWQTFPKQMLAVKRDPSKCEQGKQFASCVKTANNYVQMRYLLDGFLSKQLKDPTRPFCDKGAWFFLNARTVKRRYGKLPPFARGKKGLKIGDHTFYCWSK